MNTVILIGNLGGDPELKTINTKSGEMCVCNFTMATHRKDKSEWHRVVVWGKQAQSCALYLIKGAKVAINGELQTRSWEDKDGGKRYTTEVVARFVEFLDIKKEKKEEAGGVDDYPF